MTLRGPLLALRDPIVLPTLAGLGVILVVFRL